MSNSTKPAGANPESIQSLADAATRAIADIAAALPLDGVTPRDLRFARGANRVPQKAMSVAAELLRENRARFPDLDPDAIDAGIQYEVAMTPVLRQLAALSKQIHETLQHRRSQAAATTLTLYQSLKGLARITPKTAFPRQQQELARLLTTTKTAPTANVTHGDEEAAAKPPKPVEGVKSKVQKAEKIDKVEKVPAQVGLFPTTLEIDSPNG